MRKFVLFIFVLALCGCSAIEPSVKLWPVTSAITLAANPKVAAYWTSPKMSQKQAEDLSKFHLVVVDMENMVNNYSSLQLLKKLNSAIKLLAYSNPMEFFIPMVEDRPLQKQLLGEVENDYPSWFLKQPDGRPVIFWQGMQMLNLSSDCPLVNSQRWSQYLACFLLDKVLSDPIWDGYFMDNSGGNISWVNNGQIDADADDEKDDPKMLDMAWSEGIREFLTTIRQAKGKNFILVGNKGSIEFLDIFNGKMFEEFPNDYLGSKRDGGWHQSLTNYVLTGPYSIVQAKSNGDNWRQFVLASALLGNGYFIYGQNNSSWFPEYQEIGKPVGVMKKMTDGSYRREYEKATAIVWPEKREGKIQYK